MDTGSSDYYINRSFAEKHSLVIQNFAGEVTLAETSVCMPVFGQCFVNSDLKQPDKSVNVSQDNVTLRRSTRDRKPVDQYGMIFYV